MKPNVDLTENRVFTDRDHHTIADFSLRIVSAERLVGFKRLEHMEDGELILTGNAHMRSIKRMADEEMSGEYCPRCGARLSSGPPWLSKYGLCSECTEQVMRESEAVRSSCQLRRIHNEMIASESRSPFRFG